MGQQRLRKLSSLSQGHTELVAEPGLKPKAVRDSESNLCEESLGYSESTELVPLAEDLARGS